MAMCGKMCLKVVVENEALKCHECGVLFHQECVNIQKQLCQDMIRWKSPNVQFRCDKCVEKDDSVKMMLDKISVGMVKMNKANNERFKQMIERVDNIESSLSDNGKKFVDEIVKVVEENKKETNEIWTAVTHRKNKKKKTSDPVVVITPKDKEQDRNVTKRSLRESINPTEYSVRGWSSASNNAVVIQCENNDERDKLMRETKEKLGDNYDVKKPKTRLPRMKILKVEQPDDDNDAFLKDLRGRNPSINNDKFKLEIIYREQVKIKGRDVDGCFNIVLQTDGETFKTIMSEGRLRTTWKICKVVDNVYLRRCYKCYGFNHESKDCVHPNIACSSCSLPHLQRDCKATDMRCIVCVNTNKRIKGLNLQENHTIWSKECPVYQRKLAISKQAISYVD